MNSDEQQVLSPSGGDQEGTPISVGALKSQRTESKAVSNPLGIINEVSEKEVTPNTSNQAQILKKLMEEGKPGMKSTGANGLNEVRESETFGTLNFEPISNQAPSRSKKDSVPNKDLLKVDDINMQFDSKRSEAKVDKTKVPETPAL